MVEAVQRITRSRTFNRWLPWVAALVLAAGIVTFLVTFYGNTADPLPEEFTNQPVVDRSQNPNSVPLSQEARRVAGEFILTAVARKNLDRAYQISSANLRQGMTLKEWRTGSIPVVPYDAEAIDIARMKVDYSYKREALLEVALLPRTGSDLKPQIFMIELRKIGKGNKARWVVEAWTPREFFPVRAEQTN